MIDACMIVNALTALLAVLGWLIIVFGADEVEGLAARGWASLKFFTVLSNLFAALVAVAYLVVRPAGLPLYPQWLVTIKIASASCVMLTFLTVIFLLAPRLGLARLLEGGNFFLHLVVPVLAAIDCVFWVPTRSVSVWATAAAMGLPALYGMWYARSVLVHGAKENGIIYDFYGFLRWGKEKIPVVFAGMLGATWAIAAVFWLVG